MADGSFGRLLQERMRESGNMQKRVRIDSVLERDVFRVTIKDDGDGFDWRSMPEPTAETLLAFNGRGVFLTKIYFDEVIYNEIGNEVTLTKKLG
jgi:anti-sigma regulatory factor (Ser/Thr protein kinase)